MVTKLPRWSKPLFDPFRYKVLYGGRGSAKSHTVARVLLIRASCKPRRILCAREFQNSISESVHKLLCERIDEMKLPNFTTTNNSIYNTKTKSEFIFKGVHHNVDSIKSMEGLTDLWLEEAHTVSQRTWDILIPTMRAPDSEIFVTFNPENEDDPTYVKFIQPNGEPREMQSAFIRKVNWNDNPWFPDVLKMERDEQYAVNPELAEHIWEGACRSQSDAQIFKGKYKVEWFEVEEEFDGPYYGADWGFSKDPTTLVKMYIDAKNRRLLLRHAVGGVGVELDDIPTLFDRVPGSRDTVIRADNARPETISFMCKKGFRVEAAKKWEGSVEDGIEFMKTFREIIIHPECQDTQHWPEAGQKKEVSVRKEFKNYSYKVDRLTGDVTVDIVDDWNHYIDGCRYGLEPMISSGTSLFDLL